MAVSTIDPNGLNIGQIGGRRNLLINSDFSVAQRGTSVTPSSGFGYTLDRWRTYSYGSSTTTVSQQSFTAGQTDVPGSPQYFARVAATNTRPYFEQKIENVIPFGGQTVTISLWAKSSDIATLQLDSYSEFGTGGSSAVVDNNGYSLGSLSGTWTKFTHTWTIPSHSGKTIGTNNCYAIALTTVSGDIGTVDIALVQLEIGDVATPFEHRSYGEELALCQRYYQRQFPATGGGVVKSSGNGIARVKCPLVQIMRVSPSVTKSGNPSVYDGSSTANISSLDGVWSTPHLLEFDGNLSATLNAEGRACMIYNDATQATGNLSSAGFILDAEL